MKALLAAALALAAGPAWAQMEVENAWSRATAPGASIAAGYMVLRNRAASPDRLLSASSELAQKVETHVTVKDGEVLRMREVKGYEIPARSSLALKPGGAHLMLVGIKRPFREGEKVPLTLRFEKAGEKRIELQVSRSAPGASAGHHKH